MTRNLVEAKAWEGGRREICARCRHFAGTSTDAPTYEWQNCQKLNNRGHDESLWERGTCHAFESIT